MRKLRILNNPTERAMLAGMRNMVDHAEGDVITSVPAKQRLNQTGSLRNVPGNPMFKAEVDLKLLVFYFTLNGGAYTNIAAAALNAGLKNPLRFFLFGYSDYAGSGYAKSKGQYPINANWVDGRPGIYGKDSFSEFAFDATVTGFLANGDIVIPYTSPLPGTGTTTLALYVIRSQTVNAGSLLLATGSDRFKINGIRYTLDDAGQVAQFSNSIGLMRLTLFGKFGMDTTTPSSYKQPGQFQDGIVDLPIEWNISKHTAIAIPNEYTNVSSNLSVFILAAKQLMNV